MTSRVRCSCGRIYDPTKHTTCPDCGAESAVESIVVAEKVKPPVPPTIEPEPKRADQPPPQPSPIIDLLKTLPWPVYAGAALFLLILILILRPRHGGEVTQTTRGERAVPSPPATSSPSTSSPTVAPTLPPQIPSSSATIPPNLITNSVNLADLIANAAAGGTVTVPAGLYPGGLVITKSVHIVGDPHAAGQVFIQSEGKECMSVRAKGVTIQGVQFFCNGIGDLPAVSVTNGAELEMDSCKVQSGTGVGVLVTDQSSVKAVGAGLTAAKGTAIRVNKQSQVTFNQSSFSDSQTGIALSDGAKAELHSCAFERIGMMQATGAIINAAGDGAQLTGDDCHFTNNSVGIKVTNNASLSLANSEFKENRCSAPGAVDTGVLVVRAAGHAVVKNTVMENSSPYAINVMGASTLALDDSQIVGSRTVGLVVGDRSTPGAHADVKRTRLNRNATGIGVYAGGTVEVEDSECRENNQGVIAFESGSRVKLRKTSLISNRDHGIYAYTNSEVTAIDSTIQNNARGAQSGTPRKPAQRAVVRLENCKFGSNHVFAAGACVQSQLITTGCVFDGTDKTNIYHERGAIVQSDVASVGPESTEPPESSGSPEGSPASETTKPKHKSDRHRRAADDVPRIIRKFFPPP